MPLEIAKFTPVDGTQRGRSFNVHFNPSSLDYTVENKLQTGGGGRRPAQYVARTNGKLTMELLFDTTHSGEDVRRHTEQLAKMTKPGGGNRSRQRRPPPRALFEWGAYVFEGVVESYREKIDFFSENGVPLRATVNLTLSGQDMLFERTSNVGGDLPAGSPMSAAETTVEAPVASGDNLTETAERAGDGGAARDIAAANGFESIRSPGAAVVRLGEAISLAPPVAFAAGGGLGIDIGLDAGGGAAFGAAAGLDVDFGAAGAVTLGADLRVAGAADAAAMAGTSLQASMDLGGSASIGVGGSASIGVGGSASIGVGGSASIGVGGSASIGVGAGASGSASAGAGGRGGSRGAGGLGMPAGRPGASGGAPVLGGGLGGGRSSAFVSLAGGLTGLPQAVRATSGSVTVSAASIQKVALGQAYAPPPPSTSAGSEGERGVFSAGVPAAANPFTKLVQPRGFRRHTRLDPESLVRSVEIEGYGTGAGVGFRIGGEATMFGESSVAADVGQSVRLSERIRFDGEGGNGR